MKTTAMSSLQSGFSLIELMVALLVMVVISTAVMRSLSGLQDPSFYQQTAERVQAVKDAIIKVQTVNGVPTVSGFVADMGRLPNNLRELLDNSAGNPVWATGACSVTGYTDQFSCGNNSGTWAPYPGNTGIGWRGPYIQASKNPSQADAFTDGWGRDYQEPGTAQGSCASQHWLLDVDNTARCHVDDLSNYGWRFDTLDPPTQTTPPYTYNSNLLNLQSYGSDMLQGQLDNTNQYQYDYPPSANQPVIKKQDWQFDLGPTAIGVTVNLSHTNFNPSTFTATQSSDIQTLCNIVGGTWATPNCIINSTLCGVLGGTWNGTTNTSGTCSLTQQPLQSLCTSASANGSWSNSSSQCTLTTLSSSDCTSLGGSYSSGICTLPAPPLLATTCNSFIGTSSSPCTLPTGSTIFSNTTGISGISGFCSAIGGYWNSNKCIIEAPFSNNLQTICLNIFYRNSTVTPPIVTATTKAAIQNDGQPHTVSFSGFSVYDQSGAVVIDNTNPASPHPVPIPIGQNAISVTQANSDGTCTGTPWNNAPFPANHPSTPILQTFLPGLPLIFNW